MALNLANISYFAPLVAFLLVTSVSFAVLLKTKIFGEHRLGLLFVSFLIATLFVFFAGARTYVQTVVPWFAVLLVSFAFVLVLVNFGGDVSKGFKSGIGVFFILAALLVLLVSGVVVFADNLSPYVPGTIQYRTTEGSDWLYSSNVMGAIVLLIVAGITSAVLLMKGGKK